MKFVVMDDVMMLGFILRIFIEEHEMRKKEKLET